MNLRRTLAVALTAGSLIALTGSVAHSAEQDGLVGIRAVPTASSTDDRGFFVEEAAKGSTIVRHVAVSNRTDAPVRVRLYAGPAEMQGDNFVFADRGEASEATRWTRVTPGTVDVQPGREVRAKVRITVPDGAKVGDHFAVVWAELSNGEEAGLNVVNRVGVRLYLTVGAATGGSSSLWLIVLAALVLGIAGFALTRLARRRGIRDFSGRYALRRNPWPKNPPRGRAWA